MEWFKKMAQMLKQYGQDAMPGGALNPELQPVSDRAKYISGLLDPNSQISRDTQGWHKRTQVGLADQIAGRDTPEAEQAYQTMMQAAGMAPVGMIAWHGSPHKFNKFDLSKIGTGEGAQAYGHGLYLAESPGVARSYQQALSGAPKQLKVDGKAYNKGDDEVADFVMGIAGDKTSRSDVVKAINEAFASVEYNFPPSRHAEIKSKLAEWGQGPKLSIKRDLGNLYKTDIPDEAVARFLDWDKPLSQQAPEVQAAISKFNDEYGLASVSPDMTGKQVYQAYENAGAANSAEGLKRNISEDISGLLKQYQIPGIRYLDGGSRGTGTGTSNFVAFDPEMIRILERNGQPTGLQPWKPGEWPPLKK